MEESTRKQGHAAGRSASPWRVAASARRTLLAAAFAATALAGTAPGVGAAEVVTPPACPTTLDGQPLSVTPPFSGVVRPRTDSTGTVVGGDLLCAYGDGVRPAAELLLTWTGTGPTPCTRSDLEVAPELDRGVFAGAVDALAEDLGPPCAESASAPTGTIAAAGALVLAGGAWWWWRRRRGRAETPPSGPEPDGRRPVPATGAGGGATPRRAAERVPDAEPVLTALGDPAAAAFRRRATGRLAAAAAAAYVRGEPVIGDLARAGALQAQVAHRPDSRPDAALTHQDRDDRR